MGSNPKDSRGDLAGLYFRIGCFVLFFVAAAASFSGFYQKWHFSEADVAGDNSPSRFEGMVDGTASRPYVYRQLLPAIANGVDRITPERVKDWMYADQEAGDDAALNAIAISPTAHKREYFFRYVVVYVATFLFALLGVYGMYLVCRILGMPLVSSMFAPVILILLIPYIMSCGGYFYDYPELAMLSMGVWVALRFEWWWLVPVVVLGEWNKESFLLITVTLYPLLRTRGSRARALMATGALCVICVAIYMGIRMRFAHNPGGTVEMWWGEQWRYFVHPVNLFFGTEDTYGVRMLKIYTVFPMSLLVWTVVRGWKRLPKVIREHGKLAAAINVPLYVLFSWPGELRDFSMLYMVLLLLLAGTINELVGVSASGIDRLKA